MILASNYEINTVLLDNIATRKKNIMESAHTYTHTHTRENKHRGLHGREGKDLKLSNAGATRRRKYLINI